MSLSPGTRLGSYEIVGPLGAGGMGEVYRARDAALKRDVALKILPEAFASDAERLARFEREAQTLAALNHPNIAHIYGVVPPPAGDATTPRGHALVMELVEGEDLSAVVARGPMPLDDVLPIARQLAAALEAAHEQGIVHRDLKPGNVKVRPDGTVKVLDFGLAKAVQGDGSPSRDPSPSQLTMTSPAMTAMGMILGTAAYMAPEQARGKAVDKRADIWAFGVVLYEMLTGRRAFEGDDVSTTLAAVLMRDPEWRALPDGVPPALVRLVRRCLERDPKVRLRDIGEARVLLADPDLLRQGPVEAAPSTAAASRAPWIVAAAFGMAAILFGVLWTTTRSPTGIDRIEASLAPPPGHTIGASFALSPDGRRLVMEAVDEETGLVALWLRELSSGTPQRLPGTESGIMPFWSPDGSGIAFFAEGKLKRIDLQGGPPQVICDAPSPRGGAWGPDDTIVFAASFRTGLERVAAGGGRPATLTTLDADRGEKSHRWPVFLPDGEHVLFVAQTGEATARDDTSTIEALALATGERTRIVTANSSPLYSPAGYLLFWREDALRGQAFDARRLSTYGPVFTVATDVAFDTNEYVQATVSGAGTLVYADAGAVSDTTLLIVDRAGRPLTTVAESGLFEGGMSASHDGTRLAASLTAPGARSAALWIYDLRRGTSGPLTFEEGVDSNPVWSADDTELLYANQATNDGRIFRRRADGQGQPALVAETAAGLWPSSWSSDGTWLVAGTVTDATSFDIVRYDIADEALTPLANTPFGEQGGVLSPDDRWLAYQSDETGRNEIYVRSLRQDQGRWRVSTLGGTRPSWSHDGRELYFISPVGQVMAVGVETTPTFRAGPPEELFRALFARDILSLQVLAALPDGKRFAINVLKERRTSLFTLVTNWTSVVERE